MSSIPTVLSILVCDSIIIEAGTGKKSFIGVFDVLNARALPVVHSVGFFARLTDLEGKYRFTVKVVHLDVAGEKPVAGLDTQEQEMLDPLAMMDLALTLPIKFPALGRYEFQLFANDCYVGRATMVVSKIGS